MTFTKWILCHKWKYQTHSLSDVYNVNLLKAGIENVHSNTVHYKVNVFLKHGANVLIAETKSQKEAFKKVMKIRKFLGIEGEVHLKDVSRI